MLRNDFGLRGARDGVGAGFALGSLRAGGFVLLDTQYVTDHLKQFGVVEISGAEYERRLAEALGVNARWVEEGERVSGGEGEGDTV